MANVQSQIALERDTHKSLRGKVTWVTGATRGIGRAIALAVAEAGSSVAFTYRTNTESARKLQRTLEACDVEVWSAQQDVTDFEGTQKTLNQIVRRFGKLDGLVNNAGIIADSPLYLMEKAQWENVLQTNLTGVFNGCRAAITTMMKQGSGRIVNISSVAGLIGVAGQTNYCASKAGIIGFSRALAKEVSSFQITVNVVAPGYIETEMTAQVSEEKRKQLAKRIPLGRIGTVEEVASLVCFLLSEEAGYITGQVVAVDGGLTG